MTNSLDDIILAFALKETKYTMDLVDSFDSKYFEDKIWLFDIIKSYFTDPKFKEIPTVDVIIERVKKNYSLSEEKINEYVNDFKKLKELSDTLNSGWGWYVEKLRKRFNNKVQKNCAENILKTLNQNLDESEKTEKVNNLIKETAASIDSIYKKQVFKEGGVGDRAPERWNKYEFIEKNPESAKGILTGFGELDRITNGLHPGEFMIIGGETGSGKSIVMHNIGVNAYLGKNNPLKINDANDIQQDTGCNVLYFSLEMPIDSIERRIDSCIGDVYYNQLRDGKLSEEDKKKYKKILYFQKKYNKNFYIVDMPKNVTTREIELKFNEISETKFKPDLVIIDYMGIMSANSPVSDWLDLGLISAELHEFARVYNIPVITGSQLNRSKEGVKKDYSTDRIARSSMISTNANIIIEIESRGSDEYLRTDIPIHIAKMRDGEKGSFTLTKNFGKMKVIDLVNETFSNDEESIDDSI